MPTFAPTPAPKPGLIKSVLLTGLLALATAPLAVSAAQGVDLRTDIDFTTWTRFGTATVNLPDVGSLALTLPHTTDAAGAAYAPSSTLINFNQAFEFNFIFFVPPGTIQGDGMTFVLTGDNPATSTPLGQGGSGLGYQGSNAGGGNFAFAVDTFHFAGEPVSPSIQILQDGSITPLAFTETGLSNFRDPSYFQWTGTLAYAPSGLDNEQGLLTGSIDQFVGNLTFTVATNVNWSGVGVAEFSDGGDYLGRSVFYGFTGANGVANDGHFVTSVISAPVPEPQTYGMLLAGLGLIGAMAMRRRLRTH